MSDANLGEGVETILTGFALFLRDTAIPHDFQRYLDNPELEPKQYLGHACLTGYLGKIKTLLQKILPKHEFWLNEEALADITGEKFKKACERSHRLKANTFGQESKIGLYRVARNGGKGPSSDYVPHWTCLINCEEICKNMMNATRKGDTYNKLTEKRLALLLTKHAVGRGGEAKHLNIKTFSFDDHCDCLNAPWVEQKTSKTYACPFVPNKDGYATDVYHALGSYFVCGKGLYRDAGVEDSQGTRSYLIPHISNLQGSGASRWLSAAIRKYLPDAVPEKAHNSVSAVSLRIAGITEMGVGNVGYYDSHARSGHIITSRQENYFDRDNISCSLTAAKCLAGWSDYHSPVYLPNIYASGASEDVINRLIDHLVMNSFEEFEVGGPLRRVLLATIASLIMYDRDVTSDMKDGQRCAISKALRDAFKAVGITSHGASSPTEALEIWGEKIRADFRTRNLDFLPLTSESNGTDIVNTWNKMGANISTLHREHTELHAINRQQNATIEAQNDRIGTLVSSQNQMVAAMNELIKSNHQILAKLNRLGEWNRLPSTPSTACSSPSMRKRPHDSLNFDTTTLQSTSGRQQPIWSGGPNVQNTVAAHASSTEEQCATGVAQPEQESDPEFEHDPDSPFEQEPAPSVLEANYNAVDAEEKQGGTQIQDIITDAHANGRFKSRVMFRGLMKPGRFKDNSKFKYCLECFEYVADAKDRRILATGDKIEVENVANDIARRCLSQLDKWEGRPKPSGGKKGYTGVGQRVQRIISKFSSLENASTQKTLTPRAPMFVKKKKSKNK